MLANPERHHLVSDVVLNSECEDFVPKSFQSVKNVSSVVVNGLVGLDRLIGCRYFGMEPDT